MAGHSTWISMALPWAVEFAGQSVTSPGFESFFPGAKPDDIATALRDTNPQLHWADTSHRGYMTVTLTPNMAKSTWHFLDTIRNRSPMMKGQAIQSVQRGQNQLVS